MFDYEGETSNEATNDSHLYLQKKVPKKSENTSVEVPNLRNISQRWCTGEALCGPEIEYKNVPGSVYKYAIFIEGKYQKLLVGVLRMTGYEFNDDSILEVTKIAFTEQSYENVYGDVYESIQLYIKAALNQPNVCDPTEYRKLRAEGKISSAKPVERGECRHAHRFPVKRFRYDECKAIDKTKCDRLHMRLDERTDSFVLCRCGSQKSLFSHIKGMNENCSGHNSLEELCANCAAISKNLV